MRCLALGLAITGMLAGVLAGLVVFVVGVVFSVFDAGAGAIVIGAFAATGWALLGGLAALGVLVPRGADTGGVLVLVFAGLHMVSFALVGAWPAGLPGLILLGAAGVLMRDRRA